MESTGEPVTGNRKRREVSMLSNDSGYSTGSALSQPEGCRRASGTYTTKVAYAAPEIPLSAPSEVDDARTLSAYSNDSGYYSTSSGQLKMPPRYNSDDVAIDQQFAPKFYRSTTRGSRPFTAHEDLTARTFETHASVCFECRTINGARNAHHHFCNAGKRHAERVESLFYMTERGDVMSWNSAVRVEVPSDLIEFGKLLKSIGDSAFVVARASRTKAKFPSASIRRAVTFSEDSGPRETPSRILRLSDASEDDEDPPARGSLYESDVKALRRFEKQRSTVVIRSGGKEQDDPTTRKTTDARRRQEQSDRLLAEKLAREEESRQARIELSPHEIKESMLADDRTAERLLGEASTLKSTWIEKQQGSRREFQMRQLTATQEESRQGRSELLDSSETARLRAETTALERGKAEEIQATHTMNRLRRLSISSDSSSGFRSHSSLLGGKLKPVKFSCLVPAQRRSRSPHSHVSEHSSRQVSSLLDQPQRPKQLPKSGYICQELEELGVRGFVSSPELPSHAQGTERSDANGDAESDTSEMHTLPRSVNRLLETAIFGVKQLLLQELVDYALPEAMDGVESSSSSEVLPTSRSIVQSGNRKRVRGDGRDPGEEPDSDDPTDDDNDRPKKRNGKGPSGGPSRRLKCPFYQRQPEKYTKAACRGEGFADMAKLKDHIKRVHTQPLRCHRCRQEMKSDDAYEAHLQRPTACDVRPEPAGDNRISQKALKRLDFKKAPYAHAASVEDKWKIMYKRLFPNDRDVPSAFDQCGMSPRMERALAEALEEQLTSELTPVLEPILRRIKDRIPMIIESCRMKLMQLSSDDEVVLATSGTPSTNVTSEQNNSNSDSDRLGSNLQTTDTSRSVSRCSVANLVSLSEGDHTSKAKGKRAQRAGSDASRSTLADGSASCHSSSPESVFDKSLPSFGTVTHQQTNQTDLGVDVFDFQLFPDNTVNGADHAASPPFDYPGQELGYSTTFDGFQPQDGGFSIAGPPTTIGRYPTVTNLYFGGTSKQMTSSQVQYHPEPAIPVQQLSGTSDLDSILDDFDFERFFNNA